MSPDESKKNPKGCETPTGQLPGQDCEPPRNDIGGVQPDRLLSGVFRASLQDKARFVYVNPAAADMLGYSSPKELVDVPLEQVLAGGEHLRQLRQEVLAKGLVYGWLMQARRKDGRIIWITLTAKYCDDNSCPNPCIQGMFEDTTERKEAEDELQGRTELLEILTDIATRFINYPADQVDDGITETLRRIGRFAGADRSYVFRVDLQADTQSNTHEWCEEGIEPQIHNLQNLPLAHSKWWANQLYRHQTIHIPCIASLGEEAAMEKEALSAQDIKSLVVVPMVMGDKLFGFIGFDAVREEKHWPNELVALLKVVAEIIANALNRQQIHMRLEASEQRYRSLVQSLPVGVFRTTPDDLGQLLMANQAAASMFGYDTVDEYLAIPAWVSYGSRQRRQAMISRVISQGRVVCEELRLYRKDGTPIWVALTAHPRISADGKVEYVEGLLQDITQAKHAMKALGESEARFREILENSRDLTYKLDLRTISYEYISPSAINVLGFSAQEIFDQGLDAFLQRLHPQEEGWMRRGLELTIQGKLQEFLHPTIEYRWKHKSGQYRWYSDSRAMIRDRQGQPIALIGNLRDITESKAAQEALRESENHYRGLVESQQDLIVRFKPDGRFTFVNDAYCRKFGKSRQELLGKEIMPLVHVEDRQATREAMEDLYRPPYRATMQQRARTAEGWRWLEWEECAIRNQLGKIVEIQGVGRDITERKQAEDALKAMHRKLMNAREEERRYLATELHDAVGQSLVAMRLRLQTLAESVKEVAGHRVGEIFQMAQDCHELIREVRHICHGLYPPTLQSLGLVAALQQLASHCDQGGVNGDVICDSKLESLRFSPDVEIAVFRIAQEAVSNALRHGRAENITIEISYEKNTLRMSVLDDGVGFDLSETRCSGIGLNTMQERCQAVGGEFMMQSEPGQTRIDVTVETGIVDLPANCESGDIPQDERL